MEATIRRLRSTAQQLARGKHPCAVRYPAPFRDAVITLAQTRVAGGQSLARVAQAVGISFPTLAAWLERPEQPGLRPVALASTPDPAPASRSSVVLVTPQGFRVEGLDGAALVAVLRALARSGPRGRSRCGRTRAPPTCVRASTASACS